MGRYLDALVAGEIPPVHPLQVQLVEECAGRRPADLPGAKAWLKMNRFFPQRRERESLEQAGRGRRCGRSWHNVSMTR